MSHLKTFLLPVLLVAVLAAPAFPVAEPASAGLAWIQPGDRVSFGNALCTLNFVFDGVGPLAGKVYIGTAAHCVSHVGQSASTTSWADFGTVAYIGNGNSDDRDYAFVEVKPEFHSRVNAAVRGHENAPTGATANSETALLDPVRFSGYGMGFEVTPQTREERIGVLVSDSASTYVLEGPIIFGDSGGPIVHLTSNKALGIVSSIVVGCCAGPGVYNTGPTIQGALSDAAARGFPLQLRTV